MKALGFKYEVPRKIYYVDSHEKHETKKYRKKMVREYFKNELRMYRLIHLPEAEVIGLEQELEIKLSNGHKYTDPHKPVSK